MSSDRRQFFINLISDVRFWIGLFAVLHLMFITLPPLEPASTWRQTDGLMIARNFYEINSNIIYPTTDVAGDKTGITGCEFPLINYAIAMMAHVFGYHDWFGRLLNVLLSSVGLFHFFKLLRDQFGKPVAFNATLVILASIWFTYNRTNIPDTFAVSLCMISIYYSVRYLQNGGGWNFTLFVAPALIGCLIRISCASLLTVLIIPFFTIANTRTRVMFGIGSMLILVAAYSWYFIWVPYLNSAYGFSSQFFMGMGFVDGLKLLASDLPLTLKRFYDTPFKYSGFIIFISALVYAIKKRERLLLLAFAIPFIAYTITMIKLAVGWHVDAYYVMMYVPPMAMIVGWGLAQLNKRALAIAVLAIVMIEGVGNQFHVLSIREPYLSLTKLEGVMDGVSKRTDLIATNGIHDSDPTPMYMAHRRGWVLETTDLANTGIQADLKNRGCKFILVVRKAIEDVTLDLPVAFQSDDFTVYQLN